MRRAQLALLVAIAWVAHGAPTLGNSPQPGSQFQDESTDPNLPHSPGLYMLGAIGGEGRMTKIRPVTLELTGDRLTVPLFNARIQTADERPVFYAYFDRSLPPELKEAAMGDWEGARENGQPTPGVVLIRLAEGANWRFRDKPIPSSAQIPYDSVKVRVGVFRIQPKEALAPGEYGFVQVLPAQGRSRLVRVFDFGVDPGPSEAGSR